MIPPLLHANDSLAEFVHKVTEYLFSIRIGTVFLMISFALFGPFGAGIAAVTRRAEQQPGFSYVQLIFTACGTMVALLVAFTWALMTFRPDEYHPTTVQMFADFAYFLAVLSVPVFGSWCVTIALPIILAEEGKEPFPPLDRLRQPVGRTAVCTRSTCALLQGRAVLLARYRRAVDSLRGVLPVDTDHELRDVERHETRRHQGSGLITAPS